jgi:hypothetical protein
MQTRSVRLLMLGCAMALYCCVSASSDEQPLAGEISKPLLAAIKKVSPNATIVRVDEVDAKSCAPAPKSPGLVRAGFNGDGLEDAAVLLKTFVSKEVTNWQGQQLCKVEFRLTDSKGGYLARQRDRFPGCLPVDAFIDLESSGKIHPIGATKDMLLAKSCDRSDLLREICRRLCRDRNPRERGSAV